MSQIASSVQAGQKTTGEENIKETLQSLLIAFVLAFVFRSFFVEAFVIPTGSMAPTLLGQHVRFQAPQSGFNYAVNPRDGDPLTSEPFPFQRGLQTADPMSGQELYSYGVRTRSGDRILVLKYIYALFSPKRYDVIVFKNPNLPAQNYIKRLIGLPGEDVWLVDGDVFARSASGADAIDDGWSIQRKPDHVQREVWQPVFRSQNRPLNPAWSPGARWTSPWKPLQGDWEIGARASYRCNSSEQSLLVFEPAEGITDYTAYNQLHPGYQRQAGMLFFNVSDIRVAAGIKPRQRDLSTVIEIEARGCRFQAVISNGEARVQMRRDDDDRWDVLQTASVRPLAPKRITNVEFWHVDQSLSLWINGRRVAYGEYDWHPNERLEASLGLTVEQIRRLESRGAGVSSGYNALLDGRHAPKPARISWRFEGSPFELFRVEVDRDLYFRPAGYQRGHGVGPALATHPDSIARLKNDQYFALGDNSALSYDGRLMAPPDEWIAHRIDPDQGVVNEKLLLGKAFFVYWPSMQPIQEEGRLLVPDFGRMRFIR